MENLRVGFLSSAGNVGESPNRSLFLIERLSPAPPYVLIGGGPVT